MEAYKFNHSVRLSAFESLSWLAIGTLVCDSLMTALSFVTSENQLVQSALYTPQLLGVVCSIFFSSAISLLSHNVPV